MSQAADPPAAPLQAPEGARSTTATQVEPRVDKLAVPRQITSAQLFAGATEVHIEHHGALYRLKHTSLGKLILTK